MTFADTVRYLFSLGPELKTVKWDLERIGTLLAALGDPQRGPRFIHVAGTNGKGSTCAMIESSLRGAGVRTGLYTSPHLTDPRERIRINGEWLTEAAWVSAFTQVNAASESLLSAGTVEAPPSFFETLTAMAFVAFREAGIDTVVLETGLGGRLDATNVVDPVLSVITPIDFDHEAFLGSSIPLIAGEKAGIIKPGRPVVLSAQRPEAREVLLSRAREMGSAVTEAPGYPVVDLRLDRWGSEFTLGDLHLRCPLAGAHQVENARTAAVALLQLGIEASAIEAGIAAAQWPGRLERVTTNPDIILDGAHNPAGAKALAAHVSHYFAGEPIRLVFGAMRDKALDEVIGSLFPLATEIILTAPDQPRALSPEALLEMVEHPNVRTINTVREAVGYTRRHPMTTFITGSLFLVGEARASLVS